MRAKATSKQAADTRDTILSSALECFSRRGYADATINAIADKASVNSLTVFRHFGDKETLFRQVVDKYSKGLENYFDAGRLDAKLSFSDVSGDLTIMANCYFRSVFKSIHILRIYITECLHFDQVRDSAQFTPPVLKRHFLSYLHRIGFSPDPALVNVELLAEMFVAHVIRRALEYNRNDRLWTYTRELAADFEATMRPGVAFFVDTVLSHKAAGEKVLA